MQAQMSIKNLMRRRDLWTVAVAAGIAAAVAVTPSFAGSFLTRKAAHAIYLNKKASKKLFVTQKDAEKQFGAQDDRPFALASSSTASFTNDETGPVLLSGGELKFKVRDNALVVITFSGTSQCQAASAGKTCPIKFYVDSQPASTGDVAFDVSNSPLAAHTVTQTAYAPKGGHSIWAAFAGSGSKAGPGDVAFTLKNWNLVVQVYPGDSAP